MRLISALILTAALAGCSSAPVNYAMPRSVSPAKYAHFDCKGLGNEVQRLLSIMDDIDKRIRTGRAMSPNGLSIYYDLSVGKYPFDRVYCDAEGQKIVLGHLRAVTTLINDTPSCLNQLSKNGDPIVY